MRLFGVGLGIAGWLCSGVPLLSSAIAQTLPCTVTASPAATLVPSSFNSFGAMPLAVQSDSSSYFQVSCPGATIRSGSLMLSILNSNAYNGAPQFRVSSADGMFTNTNTSYGSSSTTLLIPATTGADPSGKVYYQVLVAAPNGQVLRAATDYAVTIKADLIIN
jgi:hypothetical protein